MTINVTLDTSSIENAIQRLQTVKDNIENGLAQTIDILTTDGATIAQTAYGGMAVASGEMVDRFVGRITASDGAGGNAIIAEFGAGDATMPVLFEGWPGVDVFPGAYSREVGSGEYAATGRWHFRGNEYTEVKPRSGLYLAKMYIEEEATNVATGVIKL